MRGDSTFFLTGTDENATKVYEAAEKAGVPPHQFVDQLANAFKSSWNDLHIGYDDFIRTSEARHVKACQVFFSRLIERGFVYLDSYEGWYSVSDETFFLDDKVKDGVAIESGKPVIRVQEQNYFFRLSAFSDKLLAYYEAHPTFLMPEFRRNEAIGFINEGLRDMCITRANKGWGIEVPGDPTRVIYVWFDALINYLAATGWPDSETWETHWPPNLHLMGKEIFVRFHATLWPAMLMALDLPLPEQIYAHGWWTARGGSGKLGKSTGGLPTPEKFTALLAERAKISNDIAADSQRYILCREMNFGLDTDFNVESCLQRYNTDLANDLGNLLNRTINMVVRYLDGVVPDGLGGDKCVSELAQQVIVEYERGLTAVRLNAALESVWKLVGRMNKFVDEKAPWTLARNAAAGSSEDALQLNSVLYTCLEAARLATVLLTPFMPVAMLAMRKQLGLSSAPDWSKAHWGLLSAGTRVAEPVPVFPRIDDLTMNEADLADLGASLVLEQTVATEENLTKLEQIPKEIANATAKPGDLIVPADSPEAVDPPISIDDFLKVQLRVGDVLAAEPVPNATKLLRLTVQLGDDDTRTILAGIAEYYTPDELIGRQVVVVANLQPRKMRGIESQGMLLAADTDGKAILLQPDSAVPSGARVR